MQPTDIQNILAELTRSIGKTPVEILPIAASGSARKYFRIVTDKRTLIGTYSENTEENEAFLTFSKHFHDLGLNVPEVFAVNADKTCYLQSDFGDDNLFAHVQRSLVAVGPSTGSGTLASFGENVIKLYKQALKHLVKFQYIGHQGLLHMRKKVVIPKVALQVAGLVPIDGKDLGHVESQAMEMLAEC